MNCSLNRCPRCSSLETKANGTIKGRVQQYRCKDCGKSWTVAVDALVGTSGRGLRPPNQKTLKAVALNCLGIPKRQIERLTGVKSETIRRQLNRIQVEGCSDEFADLVEHHFGRDTVTQVEVGDLLMHLRHERSRQESALFRGTMKCCPEAKQRIVAKASRILGVPVSFDGETLVVSL